LEGSGFGVQGSGSGENAMSAACAHFSGLMRNRAEVGKTLANVLCRRVLSAIPGVPLGAAKFKSFVHG